MTTPASSRWAVRSARSADGLTHGCHGCSPWATGRATGLATGARIAGSHGARPAGAAACRHQPAHRARRAGGPAGPQWGGQEHPAHGGQRPAHSRFRQCALERRAARPFCASSATSTSPHRHPLAGPTPDRGTHRAAEPQCCPPGPVELGQGPAEPAAAPRERGLQHRPAAHGSGSVATEPAGFGPLRRPAAARGTGAHAAPGANLVVGR